MDGHELPEDLLRRLAAFCLVPEALLLRGVCDLWKAAFRCAPPTCAWYARLAWQRAQCKEVAVIAQTATYSCTRALAASSKDVWRVFSKEHRWWTPSWREPGTPSWREPEVHAVMAQRLTMDGNRNLWLLSYLFQPGCRYVDVLQALMVEGRAMLRSFRRAVIRRAGGVQLRTGPVEGCDGRWQPGVLYEEFWRSPQLRTLASIGKCGPHAYDWDAVLRVSRGAPPEQWGEWSLHSGSSRKSAALQLTHFPTGATMVLGVGGLPE